MFAKIFSHGQKHEHGHTVDHAQPDCFFFQTFQFFFFFLRPGVFFCLNFEAVAVKKKNKKYEQNDFELTWQKKKNRSRHILKIINKRTNPSHYINVIINKPILLSNVHQTGSHKLFFFKRRSIQLAAQPRLHGYLSKGNLPNINLDSIVDENNTHVFTDHQNQ